MIIKTFLIILFIITYLHIIIHLNITNDNSIYNITDVSKEIIHNKIMDKTPFYFNGITISSSLKLDNYKKHKTYYEKTYDSIELLEPTVKCYPKHNIYPLQKNNYIRLHTNLECRNFYKVSSGSVYIVCIHPKYKSMFKESGNKFISNKKIMDYIKTNSSFIHIILHTNHILFLPNYWLIYIISKEPDTIVEKIQYSTILNQSCFLYEKIKHKCVEFYK